jgi:hypothetical protein
MIWTYLSAWFASFVFVFLKGFQHKNISGDHRKLIVVTSYAMAVVDAALIGIIVKGGLAVAIPSGTGASCGMLLSMWLHDKLIAKRKQDGTKENG